LKKGVYPFLEAEHGVELLAQANKGMEAWKFIEGLRPDVEILDCSMPELTGVEVTRKTVGASFSTRVVLLTIHDDPFAALEAQEAGAVGYVLTDVSFEELVTAIRAVADGKVFFTPLVEEKLEKFQRGG
jgi:DNA-binding NarL/FixJ family response regulator